MPIDERKEFIKQLTKSIKNDRQSIEEIER